MKNFAVWGTLALLAALSTNAFAIAPVEEKSAETVRPEITFRLENIPEDRQFISEMVQKRVAERSKGGTHSITFKIDSALEAEEFTLTTQGSETRIVAGSFPGLLFGAGKFLRSIRYEQNDFSVPAQTIREKPDCPFRECYFARHFHNWYHMATDAEMERYVEDLALQGFNSFSSLDLPVINLTNDPESADWKDLERGFRVFCRAVKRLDLNVDALGVTNQGWRDTPKELFAVPNTDPKRGNNGINVCPAKPGGREYLENIMRTVNKTFADCDVDISCLWPFDEGGCECEECRPWGGNGFLKMSEDYAKIIRTEFDPDRKFILATWCYHDDEFEILWKWLEDHPEFEYILADSHGDFPSWVLEHPLPPGRKLITFPEISMWGRGPWGGYGATVMPEHFLNLWRQVRGKVSGCKLYSEGPFEDINKIIVERFYWDNDANPYETIRDYANYEFSGANPDDFVELCRALETIHVQQSPIPPEHIAATEKAMALAEKMDREMLPSLKNRLRWRQVWCRCVLEYERNVRGDVYSPKYAETIRELQRLYHADQVPENIDDPMHGSVRPVVPRKP